MKKALLAVLAFSICFPGTFAQNRHTGYYKDIFMDGAVRLTSKKDLPVARYLGLSIEYSRLRPLS